VNRLADSNQRKRPLDPSTEAQVEVLREALARLPYEGSGPAFEALGWLTGTIRALEARLEYLTTGESSALFEPDANDDIPSPEVW
jgi:hypothetical protein